MGPQRNAGGGRGHRAVPHTADVILEAWAPDLAGCLEEAVAALAEAYADVAPGARLEARPVTVPPGPAEAQLLDLLDEVVFALDTEEGVPVAATVGPGPDDALDAVVWLAPPEEVEAVGAAPKAVAHSELEVTRGPSAVSCRALVDV